jgi:hypothetical protein
MTLVTAWHHTLSGFVSAVAPTLTTKGWANG